MSGFVINPYALAVSGAATVEHAWNSADKSSGILLLDSDREAMHLSGTTEGVRGTQALTGKACFAVEVNGAGFRVGIATSSHNLDSTSLGGGTENIVISQAGTIFYNSGTLADYASPTNGQMILVAYDSAAGDIWFGLFDGSTISWYAGDPGAGTGASKTDVNTGSTWYPVWGSTGAGPDAKLTLQKWPGAVPTGFTAYNPEPYDDDTQHWESAFYNSMTGESASWNGFNLRQFIPASLVLKSGDTIRLRFQGASTENTQVSGAYCGHSNAAGDDYDFDGTQVQVTVGSAGNWTTNTGTVTTTDELTYSLDATQDFVLAAHFNNTAADVLRAGTLTGANGYNKSAASEVSTSNVTGYAAGANGCRYIMEIQVLMDHHA